MVNIGVNILGMTQAHEEKRFYNNNKPWPQIVRMFIDHQ